MNDFSERVFQVVREIPRGKVTNYGFVAFAAGNPRASRGVGFVLHRNTDPVNTPCHRVVFKDGSLCKGLRFRRPRCTARKARSRGRAVPARRPRRHESLRLVRRKRRITKRCLTKMIKHLSFLLLKSAVVLKADVNIDCRVDALHLRVVGILPQAEVIVKRRHAAVFRKPELKILELL